MPGGDFYLGALLTLALCWPMFRGMARKLAAVTAKVSGCESTIASQAYLIVAIRRGIELENRTEALRVRITKPGRN
ncbi:hypothetical protein [Gemmata sp.]|uniref:hypothetical protein n=1 Tax=Gemmata sp. TaxID=1914242 RepID=UPI003F710336